MRIRFCVLPALLLAGVAAAQSAGRPNPADPQANVARIEYRSAFEGYRPFAEEDLRDWRKSNDEVGAAAQTTKPQPGKPESSVGQAEKRGDAPAHPGHGGHK